MVLQQQVGDRSLASKIEHRIKKLSRDEKEQVLTSPGRIKEMIDELTCST